MELESLVLAHSSPTQNLPPENGQYVTPADSPVIYENGIILSNVSVLHFSKSVPPPDPGTEQMQQFSADMDMMLSLDNGKTWSHVVAPADMTVDIKAMGSDGNARVFDTEILSMDIHGGGLPQGVMVRESPSKASLGRTTITVESGQFRIGSFFDVFTEVTTDAGRSWSRLTTLPGSLIGYGHIPMALRPIGYVRWFNWGSG